jgi:hypothetical protein
VVIAVRGDSEFGIPRMYEVCERLDRGVHRLDAYLDDGHKKSVKCWDIGRLRFLLQEVRFEDIRRSIRRVGRGHRGDWPAAPAERRTV